MKLHDKIAIITGGASGIGYATARKFLLEGAKVIICDINQMAIQKACESICDLGEISGFVADVTVKEQIEQFVETVMKKYGRIDILINNAGITQDAQLYKMTEDQWDRVIDVNLKGVYLFCHAVTPIMREQKYGKIINASSTSAFNGNFGQANYAATKAGLIGMTRVMAKELGKFNINVNAIAPGFVETEMTSAIPAPIMEQKIASIPLGRTGKPEDIANIYAFLASDEASYISGATIVADGGRS